MPRKKPYDDGCSTAHALDLIGERWALLIVRELILGPRRFSDIRSALPGISSNILTTRLQELEASHILRRDTLPPPAASQVYRLTDWGAELEPIIRAIGAWAAKSPSMQPGKPMSPASVVLSLRTMFAAEQAAGEHLRLNLVLDGLPYAAQVHARALDIEPGHIDRADVSVNGDPNLLAGVVYAGLPIDDAERAGLSVQGSRDALRRFAGLFPLPDKAAATA